MSEATQNAHAQKRLFFGCGNCNAPHRRRGAAFRMRRQNAAHICERSQPRTRSVTLTIAPVSARAAHQTSTASRRHRLRRRRPRL